MSVHYKPTGRDLELIAPTICIGRVFDKIKPAGSGAFATPITSGVSCGPPLVPCREPVGSLGEPNTHSPAKVRQVGADIKDQRGARKAGITRRGELGVLGFEPRLADSESAVLPLHHTPMATRFLLSDNASRGGEQRLHEVAAARLHQLPSHSRSSSRVLSKSVELRKARNRRAPGAAVHRTR